MSTISDGVTVVTPRLVLGWESARDSRNVVHEIIGRTDPDVTLHPSSTRAGTLTLLCDDLAHATEIDTFLAAVAVFTLDHDELDDADMRFVTTNTTTLRLDPQTQSRVILSVPYREVAAA